MLRDWESSVNITRAGNLLRKGGGRGGGYYVGAAELEGDFSLFLFRQSVGRYREGRRDA